MGASDSRDFLPFEDFASSEHIALLYQNIDRLPTHQRAALAQYILSTGDLWTAVTQQPNMEMVIQQMSHGELSDILTLVSTRLMTPPD